MFTIDRNSYSKTKVIPYNPEKECGYQPRPSGTLFPRSIIIHTTNGNKGTFLASEANFIATSREISSHYLIGKAGQIIQFLDPKYWIAYHAGCVKATQWSNPFSIGIEMHNTPTEGHIPAPMLQALDWLVRQLMHDYSIANTAIETHRAVAIFCKGHALAGKPGRKIDPSGFPDNEFYAWRNTLKPTLAEITTYRVMNTRGVNIRQAPYVNDNIAGTLFYNDTFTSDSMHTDEHHETHDGVVGPSNQWAHIYKGMSRNQSVDQLGFVSLSNLAIVE